MARIATRGRQPSFWPRDDEWQTAPALRQSDLAEEQGGLFRRLVESQCPENVGQAERALIMKVKNTGETWAFEVLVPEHRGWSMGGPKPGRHTLPQPTPYVED